MYIWDAHMEKALIRRLNSPYPGEHIWRFSGNSEFTEHQTEQTPNIQSNKSCVCSIKK